MLYRAGQSALHVLESGIKVTRSQQRPSNVPGKAGQASLHQGPQSRAEQADDPPISALVGSTSWHAVIEQAREKAVQETDRALADVSDHLKTLLVEKVQQLADLCGFVVQVSESHAGALADCYSCRYLACVHLLIPNTIYICHVLSDTIKTFTDLSVCVWLLQGTWLQPSSMRPQRMSVGSEAH